VVRVFEVVLVFVKVPTLEPLTNSVSLPAVAGAANAVPVPVTAVPLAAMATVPASSTASLYTSEVDVVIGFAVMVHVPPAGNVTTFVMFVTERVSVGYPDCLNCRVAEPEGIPLTVTFAR
jgi:hypothetical protein